MKTSTYSINNNGKPLLQLNSFITSSNRVRERRGYSRRDSSAPLEISDFIGGKRTDAELINHSDGGMCIRSMIKYNPNMNLFVRVKRFESNDECNGLFNGLRSISLGDVKWCQKEGDDASPYFRIGLRFYSPAY